MPRLPVVVLGHSPLSTVTGCFLDGFALVIITETVIIISGVEAVIESPDESCWLVLHVSSAGATFIPDLFLISSTVSVCVTVAVDIVRMSLLNEDAVIEWENDTREDHIIDKYPVLIHEPVAIRVFMPRDSRDWVRLT